MLLAVFIANDVRKMCRVPNFESFCEHSNGFKREKNKEQTNLVFKYFFYSVQKGKLSKNPIEEAQ